MNRATLFIVSFLLTTNAFGQIDIEKPPILYTDTADNNAVSRLIDEIAAGDVKLEYDRENGYLRSLLKHLDIPVSSQGLVFSKTSLQVRYISPRNPRAIYFNDDIYVGWVRGSSLMEISTADPKLGAAFYTVDMSPWKADIKRANYDCLACHSTSMTQGIPGHTVRSVQPMVDGTIDSQKPSYITDHSSPFAQRWGGWYVTGRHGNQKHMGNAMLRGGKLLASGDNERLSVRDQFNTLGWLSPYSDIVALMVLEHQTQMHNTLVSANFAVRQAIYDHDKAYGVDLPTPAKSVPQESVRELQAIIDISAKEILDFMLFESEILLTAEVKGLADFVGDFTKRGPRDEQGRSLREFDLKKRLFKYPCSYLIYSPSFDALEKPLRDSVMRQLHEVLTGQPGDDDSHLDKETRLAIFEILRETKPELTGDWIAKQEDALISTQPE